MLTALQAHPWVGCGAVGTWREALGEEFKEPSSGPKLSMCSQAALGRVTDSPGLSFLIPRLGTKHTELSGRRTRVSVETVKDRSDKGRE